MSVKKRNNHNYSNQNFFQRAARAIGRAICIVVVVAMLPFASGCHPDAIVIGLVTYSVLSVHMDKLNPPSKKPEQMINKPVRQPYASGPKPTATPAISQVKVTETKSVASKVINRTDTSKNLRPSIENPRAKKPAVQQRASSNLKKTLERTSPVTEAVQAYKEMQWERAAWILNDAINTGRLTKSELSRSFILLGSMAYQNGLTKEARKYFVCAHRKDPEITPSLDVFPPQVIEFFDSVNKTK